MIEEYMKVTASSRALLGILFIVAALVGTPLAIYQLQQQQEIRQRADTTIAWATDQSAATICPPDGSGVNINVTFSNTEPTRNSTSMDVTVKDRQTGKTVNLGSIQGGQTKSGVIATGKTTLSAGTVDFNLKWTDGHSGIDSKTATYKAVTNCNPPTPTPTKPPTITPTKPYSTPSPTTKLSITPKPSVSVSPTICPTLGPVKNVRIDCPNCP
jgi:hypothetical protein